MELETILGEEGLKEIQGREFAVNPNQKYEREEFVGRAGTLYELQEAYQKLAEKPNDFGAVKNIAGISAGFMAGVPRDNFLDILRTPTKGVQIAHDYISSGEEGLARYVEENRDEMLDKLSEKELSGLLSDMPLYLSGNKEHDAIVELREKAREIRQAAQNGQDVGSVVEEEFEALLKRAPKEQQEYIQTHLSDVRKSIERHLIGKIMEKYNSLFRNSEGKLDKGAMIKFIKANYKVVEDFIDKLPGGKQGEEGQAYWGDNLKSQYLMLAQPVYKTERKAKKQKDNPDKVKREEEAREKLIAA